MANETRLIDANALKEKAEPEEVTGEGIVYVQDIDEAPTVDAVEVVHAHWIYEDDTVMKWTTKAICSACKCVVAQNVELAHEYGKQNHEKRNHYCLNCGAKMDGDGNGRPH